MKVISRRRKKVYTYLVALFGTTGIFVLAVTLSSLSHFRLSGVDPTLFLVIGSATIILTGLNAWKLRRMKVEDNESTK